MRAQSHGKNQGINGLNLMNVILPVILFNLIFLSYARAGWAWDNEPYKIEPAYIDNVAGNFEYYPGGVAFVPSDFNNLNSYYYQQPITYNSGPELMLGPPTDVRTYFDDTKVYLQGNNMQHVEIPLSDGGMLTSFNNGQMNVINNDGMFVNPESMFVNPTFQTPTNVDFNKVDVTGYDKAGAGFSDERPSFSAADALVKGAP